MLLTFRPRLALALLVFAYTCGYLHLRPDHALLRIIQAAMAPPISAATTSVAPSYAPNMTLDRNGFQD
jgi:hypothetical protein